MTSTVFSQEYAQTHLSMEADYMRDYDFPDMKAHIEQHTLFYARLRNLKQSILEHATPASFSTMAALGIDLNNWFINHIATLDQELGKFLREVLP